MNKSKFLKRPLAALLAILMVVALVPMNALAADGDTSEPETPGSDLHVTVDTFPATYADGAYTVEVKDSRTVTVDWAEVEGTVLTLVTKAGTELQLPYTLDLKTTAEDLGNDVFKLTLKEKVGTAEAVSHDLIITVRNDVPEDDTSLREVVRVQNAKGSGWEKNAISGKVEGSTITITVPFGYSAEKVGLGANMADATKVFVPTSVHAKSKYTFSNGKGQVVVTAGDGRSKRYDVNFVNEDVFTSFSVGGVEAVYGGTLTDPTLTITVPKGYAGSKAAGWTPKFETTENVVRVEGVAGWTWVTDAVDIGGTAYAGPWRPITGKEEYAAIYKDKTNTQEGTADTDRTEGQPIVPVASERATWKWADDTAGSAYSITYLNVKTKANDKGSRIKVHVKEAPKFTESKLTELTLSNEDGESYVATANNIDQASKVINMVVDRDFWSSIGKDDTKSTVKAIISTGAKIKLEAQGDKDDESVPTAPGAGESQWTITNINMKSSTFKLRVTAENNSSSIYTVNVATAGNYNTDITEFKLVNPVTGAEIVGVPNTENNIKLQLPYSLYAESAAPGITGWMLQVKASDGAIIRSGNDADDSKKLSAHKLNGAFGDPYENGVTLFGKIFIAAFTSGNTDGENGTNGSIAYSPRTLYLTVFNGDSKEVYTVSLVQADPDTKGAITGAKVTTAYDNDLVYGWKEGEKLEDAHTGAINAENQFDVTVDGNTLKLDIPYDAASRIYFEDITLNSGTAKVFRVLNGVNGDLRAIICVRDLAHDTILAGALQQNQQGNVGKDFGWPYEGGAQYDSNVNQTDYFDLSKNDDRNTIYVISEADWYDMTDEARKKLETYKENGSHTADTTNTATADEARAVLEANCTNKYTISANRGTANTGDELTSFTGNDEVKVDYNTAYKTITVTVPGSYNWATYRDSDKYDFQLNFANSENAIVIDKGQDLANNKANLTDTDGYNVQANEWDQWLTGKTTFFVKNGELYIYDKFTGEEIQVTEMGGNFDNKAWGKIKGQQAQINVYNEDQTAPNYYRLELVVGVRSNKCELTSVTVGETTVSVTGSETTVQLPEGSDLTAQNLTLVTSPMSTVLVNGEAYRAGQPYNVENPLTIVVTAEDGTKAEYTLTVTIGSDNPGPDDGKPSDKYDLSDVYSGHLEDVKKAIDMGLMSGTGAAGKFNPKGKIARQDFALIIARADMKAENPDAEDIDALLREKYADAEEAFNDISGLNDTQKAAVAHCKENGIISGNGKGGFDPKGDVTRQHAAVMIAGWCGLEHDDTANTNNIKDWNNVASWAKPYVNAVYKAGLMSGTGSDNFSPEKILERQQAATVLVGAYEKKNAEVE